MPFPVNELQAFYIAGCHLKVTGAALDLTSKCARARDFYDIPILVDHFGIDPSTADNKELIKVIIGY